MAARPPGPETGQEPRLRVVPPQPPPPTEPEPSDEELIHRLAAGDQEPLGPLYRRYGPLIFGMVVQSLDRTAAEEIVQDVFLTVWRKADTFDPVRGAFRPWVLQIAHFRILNELRRRSRRPQLAADPDGVHLATLADAAPDPAEAVWRDYQRSAVRAALDSLPPPQRQALGLAFFEDLTHEQVASVLNLPLGTAKTRIRAAMLKLRAALAPVAVALAVVASVAAYQLYQIDQEAQRQNRALQVVLSSDVQPLRMTPPPGSSAPADAHGVYRGRPGVETAVVTLSNFPAPVGGRSYQVWAHQPGGWVNLGAVRPDATGSARLIAEGPAIATPPDALEVTVEPASGSSVPTGPVLVAWPAP